MSTAVAETTENGTGTNTVTKAPAKPTLSAAQRTFGSQTEMETARAEAKAKGFKDETLRKFKLTIGGITRYYLSFNDGEVWRIAAQDAAFSTVVAVEEIDKVAAVRAPRAVTVASVLSDVDKLVGADASEATKERVRKALAAAGVR